MPGGRCHGLHGRLHWARMVTVPPLGGGAAPLGRPLGVHPGDLAAGQRVLNHPPAVVSPPANAVLPQWGVLHPLLPGYAPDGHVQK